MLDAKSPDILFQICNHNYLLADQIHRKTGKDPLLPHFKGLIIDEAHKLAEAAQQMYGIALSPKDMSSLIEMFRKLKGLRSVDLALIKSLENDHQELFGALKNMALAEKDSTISDQVTIPFKSNIEIRFLMQKVDNDLRKLVDLAARFDNYKLHNQCSRQIDHITLFINTNESIVYQLNFNKQTESISLIATPADVRQQLAVGLWNCPIPTILTSGTLAICSDFKRVRSVLGIDLVRDRRMIDEFVVASPFDYQRNCLLYLPKTLPMPDVDSNDYIQAIAKQVTDLILAAYGHTLVLFNSYRLMSRVREVLDPANFPCPLLVANRDVELTISRFKLLPNAILLATGACWEGIDFAGDVVSSLIIVTLPFSVPDQIKKQEQQRYPSLHQYIEVSVVPAMQQKLKQGFGRAIRTESDTCVVSILDPRALSGARYHQHTLAALPNCPLTHHLSDVATFIQNVKAPTYFMN